MPGGGTAIVCTNGRRRKCACGRTANILCDWKVSGKKSGTCDKPICAACSFNPPEDSDKDLCPDHRRAYAEWRERKTAQ